MITTEQNSQRFFTQSSSASRENDHDGTYRNTVKFTTSRNRSRPDDYQTEQEGNEYALRKVVRTRHQQQIPNPNIGLPNGFDEQIEDNTPLTPRMPISPICLSDYSKKATHVLTGVNDADKFLAPKAIAVTHSNQLLIADTKKHRIVIYDLNLKTMRGIKGFLFPDGLCLATD
jgi:hypothetical protein